MYALNNLFKLNDLKDKLPKLEDLSAEQLKPHLENYKKLLANTKLLNSLADKGEKVRNQLKHIEVRQMYSFTIFK